MYAAELNNDNEVIRVIVAPSVDWCVEHLGGTWVETADPYSDEPQTIRYCGPGWGHDERFPEWFAPQWQQPSGSFDDEGNPVAPEGFVEGALVFHAGRIWRSTTPGNVWEPGVSGWHDSPDEGVQQWVQPTGAHDSYAAGATVTHNGSVWTNTHGDGNVWEPGVYGWTVVT